MAQAELVHCPVCSIKTTPDHEALEFEDKLCDECYAKINRESE